MKKIKLPDLTKLNGRFLMALLTILGFAACHNRGLAPEYGPPETKYGIPPQGYFVMKGTVSSMKSQKPVPGIKVEMEEVSAVTDSAGRFEVGIETNAYRTDYKVHIGDVDSLQNGYYQDKDTSVSFKDGDFQGQTDEYYKGEKEIKVNIRLEPKK